MAQMGYIGPMLGQHHQFHHYNPGKSEFGEQRYFKIAETIYKNLDDHLSNNEYLAREYSIADMATFPWIARHPIILVNTSHITESSVKFDMSHCSAHFQCKVMNKK